MKIDGINDLNFLHLKILKYNNIRIKVFHMSVSKVILHFMKKLCLHNDDILEKLLKDWALNKKNIVER